MNRFIQAARSAFQVFKDQYFQTPPSSSDSSPRPVRRKVVARPGQTGSADSEAIYKSRAEFDRTLYPDRRSRAGTVKSGAARIKVAKR